MVQAHKNCDLAGAGGVPGAMVHLPAAHFLGAELGCDGAHHLLHLLPLWHLHLHLLHGRYFMVSACVIPLCCRAHQLFITKWHIVAVTLICCVLH